MSHRSLWWLAGNGMEWASRVATGNPQLVGFGSVQRSHGSGRFRLLLHSNCHGRWLQPWLPSWSLGRMVRLQR